MKVKQTIPVLSSISVVIEEIKYKNTLCTIEVTCNLYDYNDDEPTWSCTTASCKEPYFIMGSSFWAEEFGKRQANRIVKLCNQSVKTYLKENI
ncbi:MAG: hypothetical protein ACTSSP_00785 [Candidatus Asgardarchaeia archaeon]